MANPNPNTSGLVPFTSEPRLPEETRMASLRLYVRQIEAMKALTDAKGKKMNVSEFVREAIDAALERQAQS